MPVAKLKRFMDDQNIKYITIYHPRAYTTQEIAASAHISGKEVAKTVIIKVDNRMAMAVLPATDRIDFDLLKRLAGATRIELATEQEFEDMFPGCEVGAMPPFGNLYDMDVYVAESLLEDEEIAFNAGSHTELIKLSMKDYAKLVKPKVLKFSAKAP